MFAMVRLDAVSADRVISYSAGPERYFELLETEGIVPAPYTARIHWVAIERWNVFRDADWKPELKAAHELTLAKLPARTRAVFAMPASQQKRLITERRKLLAAKAALKKAGTTPA